MNSKTISTFLPLRNNIKISNYTDISQIYNFLVKSAPSGPYTITLKPQDDAIPAHLSNVVTLDTTSLIVGEIYQMNIDKVEYTDDADKMDNMTIFLNNGVDALADAITDSSNVQLFVADGDDITIGNPLMFNDIDVVLSIVSSADLTPIFEYSTGEGTWSTFTPTDTTTGFTSNGRITWNSYNLSGWNTNDNGDYLIRITRNEVTVVTPPTESVIQIDSKLDVPLLGIL